MAQPTSTYTLRLDLERDRKLRDWARDHDMTIRDAITQAIDMFLASDGGAKKPARAK